MKICKDCNTSKLDSEFCNAGYGKTKSYCKSCGSEKRKIKYRENLLENRELSRVKSLEFRKKNKGYQRKYDLKRNYGITEEEFHALKTKQDHKCAICKTSDPEGRHGVFAVDHCHVSGDVRGLLCNKCNVGLGSFRDNIEYLANAIDYLKKAT